MEDMKCMHCGKRQKAMEMFVCSNCGSFFCANCANMSGILCPQCFGFLNRLT